MNTDFHNFFDSPEEFAKQLDTFEKSLKAKPELHKDEKFLEFIEIFKSIQKYSDPTEMDKILPLRERVTTLEQNINYKNFLGRPKLMKEVADGFTQGNVKKGLELIDAEYSFRPIKGDGHCLFRAVSAGLLNHLKERLDTGNLSEVEGFVARLDAYPKEQQLLKKCIGQMMQNEPTIREKVNEAAAARFPQVSGYFNDNFDPTVANLMNDKTISDELVKALRKIAVRYLEDYIKTEAGEACKYILESDKFGNGDANAYLAKMKDMSREELGAAPELLALERTLGLGIDIVDSNSSALSNKIDIVRADEGRAKTEPGSIFILRRDAHYDLAVPNTK